MPDGLIGTEWGLLGWGITVLLLSLIVQQDVWQRLRTPSLLNLWLGSIVLLMVLASLKAGVRPGLSLQLSGAMLLTLMHGPGLAFPALCLVQLITTVNAGGDLHLLGWSMLSQAGIAVWLSARLSALLARHAPPQLFVYLFGNGFFGAGLCVVLASTTYALLLAVLGVYSWDYLLDEYLPYAWLLAFAEAWLTGMLLTLFVIYRPQWLCSFDDSRYLRGNVKQ